MEAEAAAAAGRNKRKGKHRILPPPKTRKLDPVNNTCYLQILGTGMDTQDTSPSVLLFFDRRRFIFNAGEGLQRFCIEHKIKLSKIDHILLTRVCSETAGGLPGLLLTLGGIGKEGMSVNLWGPSDIKYLIEAMKVFIPNTALHTHSFGEIQNCYEAALPRSALRNSAESIILIDDEEVRISAIPIRPRPSRGAMVKPCDFAVVYACELPEIKGKLDPDKALKLGLRPSEKYSQLKCGSSVMSDCGSKMIHPSDVLGPSSPGPIVLLVDCPTPSHMLEVLSLQSLNCYYMDASDSAREGIKTVNCIIHMGPASVTKNEDYQKWMKRFGSAQHIMAGHEMKNIQIPTLNSSARISSRLNYVCPQLFPASGFCSFQQTDNFSSVPSELCGKSISAENLLKFHLRPYVQLGLDHSSVPIVYNHTDFVKELLSKIPEIADSSKHVNQLWENPGEDLGKHSAFTSEEDIPFVNVFQNGWDKQNSGCPACLDNISREDLEFVLLGTGSSQPSKYRNVSSVYINLFSKGSLLLDCGEGTLAQLKRRFGLEGADDAVKGLRLIWISHFHADHHAGLARILSVRCQLLKDIPHKPLLVIGPEPLKRFLDAYSKLEDLDYQFLDCIYTTEDFLDAFLSSHDLDEDSLNHANKRDTQDRGVDDVSSLSLGTSLFVRGTTPQGCYNTAGNESAGLLTLTRFKQLLYEAGLEALYSVPVTHGDVEAFGIVLKSAKRINSTGKAIPGWKIVYSGDTTPCEALINASYDATVLIHEATFEDSMEQVAWEKNHSTTKQAIEVGESAGAYRIILTHFSQRYPKIPVLDDTCMHKTCIAFDLMSVNAADLAVLPKVVPYLKDLFRTDMAIDEPEDVLMSSAT